MFERALATILHRYLGKYIQDIDTENLNVGIFGGEVQLNDLKVKPDAFYELDLPIEVKVGTIGRINIKIPWGCFMKQPVSIEVEEVYIIAAPVTDRAYDPEKEKRLMRASKKRKLELLEKGNLLGADAPESPNFFENLITTIMNNLQIFVHNIHFRYEDSVMNQTPFACGICLQGISVETTNSKWKPTTISQPSSSVYQMVKFESVSIYCNPVCRELVGKDPEQDSAAPYTWRTDMKRGLETFSVRGEDFDFILKPITAKMKLIVNKSNEVRVPKLLVDFVLQDAATQLSRLQYLALIELMESFKRINVNKNIRKFHPNQKLTGNASSWWKYAYNGVLEQRVRPYTWRYIEQHRKQFKKYCSLYKQTLLKPTDTELKLDLQQGEDVLSITDIIIARELAKVELLKEDGDKVLVNELETPWWEHGGVKRFKDLEIVTGKSRGIWAQLSPLEKNKLFDAIGYVDNFPVTEKPKQYIEHKINFTLANCSLSLLKRGHEILVLTLAQFLASLETRPAANAYKISARVESFVLEGVSPEHDLVPIITADNIYTGNTASNFLAVDFEKNPLNSEANCGLTINVEPVEVVYHEHAISELMSFFQLGDMTVVQIISAASDRLSAFAADFIIRSIKRFNATDLNVDIKLPYAIIPELGTLQKGGNLTIVDFGRVTVTSDLQPSNVSLDDATQMEIEERLYDRFHIEYKDCQILFCDSGDLWRDAKKLNDSEFHLLPKLHFQLAFSNSVRPEYKLLPRHKLNVTLASLKINVSDRKIGSVMDFLDNLPLPSVNTVHVSVSSNIASLAAIPDFENDQIPGDIPHSELFRLKILCVETLLDKVNKPLLPKMNKDAAKMAMLTVDKSFMSSDHSDEEVELWARTVDLPGFDDNVSPNNVITILLRFIVGEVVVQLCRSCNRVDKPYLMLRVTSICCDAAIMEYGPAVQASVGSVQLIDKLHTGMTGQYLELIATEPGADVATLLYRKVRADCPDFKSHFHNVEQSLVIDFVSASIVLHREAFVTLDKYVQYLLRKTQNRDMVFVHNILKKVPIKGLKSIWSSKVDPPIPPGATKFSYSTRLQEFRIKLCDTEMEFLEIKINGLESDCLFKANERMVLQFYLSSISIEDLSGLSLYPKVLSVEEDRIIYFKYVRHSPKFYKQIDATKDDVKSDGSLKLQIGRMNLVLLSKLIINMQHFMEPFIKPKTIHSAMGIVEKAISEKIEQTRSTNTKLHLAIDIHTPSLMFPQKPSSPDLVILCLGDLVVENFFKEDTSHNEGTATPIIDNILIRLEDIQLCRAIMTLAGHLEVQEPVVDPFSIKFDIKRTVNFNDAKAINLLVKSNSYSQGTTPLLLYQVEGVIDSIRINLGQRDLSTMLSVWADNFNHGAVISEVYNCWSPSSVHLPTPVPSGDEQAVKKLQAFFYQNEHVRKETSVRVSLESVQLYLFLDCDEILSSPIRDMNRGLCKLETGEMTLSMDEFSDRSLEVKAALQTCVVEDIRKNTEVTQKKIFLSHAGSEQVEDDSNFSVSTPPIIDLTFKQTQSGDKCVDILIECTRMNLSVPFILEFTRFILDSLPLDKYSEGGQVNLGYVGDATIPVQPLIEAARPPSSTDSTSGYYSSHASSADDQTGICVSLQVRRPEILLCSSSNQALITRTEILVDYSRHPGRELLVLSLSGLRVTSKHQTPHKDPLPFTVLYPCDVEFAKSFKLNDGGLKVTTNVSFIDIHITPAVVHAVTSMVEEFTLGMTPEEPVATNVCYGNNEIEDLWSPKKVVPYASIQHPSLKPCNESYGGYAHSTTGRCNEMFTFILPKVRVMFELVDAGKRAPMILLKLAADINATNWSSNLLLKGSLQMQSSYYNCEVGAWEPLLEPCVEDEGVYRPLEMQVKVFRAKAYLIQHRLSPEEMNEKDLRTTTSSKVSKSRSFTKVAGSEESETSADEQDVETGSMMFIRRQQNKNEPGKIKYESTSMVSYPEDSDSENEEGVMEKLANAISHLFTGDSSEGEASDSNDSSGAEPSPDTDDGSELESMASAVNGPAGKDARHILVKKHSDSVDSGLEAEGVDKVSTYVMIDFKDRVELTVTPQCLAVIGKLHAAFTTIVTTLSDNSVTLTNDVTPSSSVTLLSKAESGPAKVIMTASYERSDSTPSSPASSTGPADFFSPQGSDIDGDIYDDGFFAKKLEQHPIADLYSPYLNFPTEPVACLYKKVTDQRIRFSIPGFDDMEVLCPQRTCDKLHLLQPIKNGNRYYVVLSVDCHVWGQKVTLRSPLQVRNETSYPIGIHYKKSILESLGFPLVGESTNPFGDTHRVAIVEPDETFNVPLTVAHHCKLFIQPSHVDSYSISETGLWWQDLATDLNSPKDVMCHPKAKNDTTTFAVKALCEEGAPTHRPSRLIPKYLIRLLPPLSFNNRLPYALEIKIPTLNIEVRIEAGESTNMYNLNLCKNHKIVVNVPCYLGICWTGSFNLSPDVEEKIITMATEQDTEGGNKQLGLSILVDRHATSDVVIYAPYWLINKTGLPLQLRASLTDVVYEAQSEEPLLFCFRKQRKPCVRLRAYHSSWSSAFSLDAFSTSGLVICKDRERKRKYRLLLKSDLSEVCPQLTKIITLLPNLIISNESKKALRFMEENEKADLWIDLAPSQTIAFWPETEKMNLLVKYRDSKVVSQHFPVTSIHVTVLRMDKGGALCVRVTGGGNRPFCVVFTEYSNGDAPVRVDNLCEDLFLKVHQQHLGQVALLSPYQSVLYTWDDPCKERSLLWNVYNKKCKDYVAEIRKDGYGQERVSFHMVKKQQSTPQTPTVTAKLSASLKRFSTVPSTIGQSSSSEDSESDEQQKSQLTKKTRKDKVVVYWVSYMEGPQRVLMFTQDERMAYKARLRIDAEKSYLELFFSLKGFGLSLSNKIHGSLQELAYLSLRDSAPIWEVSVAHRWKPLTLELAAWIEDRWKLDLKKAQMKELVHVDFEKMHMTKPFFGELRRRWVPAVWVQYRRSVSYSCLHFKTHLVQLENQLRNAVFPIVIHPKQLPRAVLRKTGGRPCLELSVLKRYQHSQRDDIYKSIKLLVQEFVIQVDKNFMLQLYSLYSPWITRVKPSVRIRSDIAALHLPLSTWTKVSHDAKVYIEHVHLSPLTFYVSFLSNGSAASVNHHYGRSYMDDIFLYFCEILTPTHMEIKGLNLRTTYFERKGIVDTKHNHLVDIVAHYTSQLMPQLHVMMFNLDILSNPYSLVTDFTDGLGDLYYEPSFYQIDNSEEYSEGLSIGAQILMGHVKTTAGNSSSLITTGIVDSSLLMHLDDETKKKRKLCLLPNSELPNSLLSYGRTFEVGIALGMSGLIIKQQIGTQQHDGIELFFRSIGKGLMGLLTKPTGTVFDCIAMASDGIRRASEMGEEIILRTRQPRHMDQYLGVRPYSPYEAAGKQLLNLMNKGHYSDTDVYWTHAPLGPDGKTFLLVTVHHMFLVEKCRLWGSWEVEWGVRVDDVLSVPSISGETLIFKVRKDETFTYLNGNERTVTCSDLAVLQWLQKKIEAVMILNMEDKPCSISTTS
ncbi:Vacuolar protein sorting-associated protein [Nesidiocoris tenuis]|uniref:Vacuolar protein sorting-associated protein n=1 Tax=Nesidiocoris tenuis TaxID=355587 RepID=A0ABN7BAI7_9HEMI|nr:Vacuolar protein sorting-associated protein [Nesidiocoris tenuis]